LSHKKNVFLIITLLCMYLQFFSGCAQSGKTDNAGETIQAVATIGMIADVVKVIGGEHVHVHGLMGPGVDPHLYKATPSDVQALQKADIIFYNGLHLEAKMGELFEKMAAHRTTVAVSQSIPQEKLLAHADYDGLYDPHVWFDLTLWKYAVSEIEKALSAKKPEHRAYFTEKSKAFQNQLDSLHSFVLEQAATLPEQQRILVTAHDAFKYFGRQYGFQVVGLQGISTDAEAGTNDVQELVSFIVKKKIKAIFVESSVPIKNIQAVQEAVKAKGWKVEVGGELFSDAMGDAGTFEGTYLGMVSHNINTIVSALSGKKGHE